MNEQRREMKKTIAVCIAVWITSGVIAIVIGGTLAVAVFLAYAIMAAFF